MSPPRYLYRGWSFRFACWPLGMLQWSPPCLEEYNSLDHSPTPLLYCVCVGEHGVEMYSTPFPLVCGTAILSGSIVWRRE